MTAEEQAFFCQYLAEELNWRLDEYAREHVIHSVIKITPEMIASFLSAWLESKEPEGVE